MAKMEPLGAISIKRLRKFLIHFQLNGKCWIFRCTIDCTCFGKASPITDVISILTIFKTRVYNASRSLENIDF